MEDLISRKINVIQAIANGELKLDTEAIEDGRALCLAAEKGTPDTIEALLELGAKVNQVMRTGNIGSALVAACLGKQEANVQFLIQKGADINMPLVRGEHGTALTAISAQGDLTIADDLLHAGASINMPVTSGRYGSALAAACHGSGMEMIQFLINQGANINKLFPYGDFSSALAAAICGENSGNVKLLLDMGADPNISFPSGSFEDALSLAIHLKKKVAISYLIAAGAHVGPLASDMICTGNLVGMYADHHMDVHGDSSSSCDPSSTHFTCELPELVKDCQDISSWLSNVTVLVRKEDTIEYSTVHQFLLKTYGSLAIQFMNKLTRALKSKEGLYGEHI